MGKRGGKRGDEGRAGTPQAQGSTSSGRREPPTSSHSPVEAMPQEAASKQQPQQRQKQQRSPVNTTGSHGNSPSRAARKVQVEEEEDGSHDDPGASNGKSPSLRAVGAVAMTASAKRRHRERKGGNRPAGPLSRRGNNKRRHNLVTAVVAFVLGVLALFFAQRAYPEVFLLHFNSLPSLSLPPMPPLPNISLPVLPTGLEIQEAIMNEIQRRLLNFTASETVSPGMEARAKGYTAKYPVIMIPGFVTTGLEVWEGEACAQKYFRQRLWGTLTMLQTMIFQPECWAKHMALDMATGLDPPGVRLRPAQGFEAADFFLPGLWVWAKLIQDLSLIGYDYKNLALMSYDWRLSLPHLEERDRYFTLLKNKIELMKQINGGNKVVLIAHSYGTNVLLYFLKWVESERGGKGGPKWVDQHIHALVNIAGPLLGVIKALTSYVSGEMHDTAELGALENILWGRDSNVFNKRSRMQLFRTWGSLTAMLPKGGTALWGNDTYAPEDDDPESVPSDQPICVTSSEPHGHVPEGEGGDGSNSTAASSNSSEPGEGADGVAAAGGTCEQGLRPVTKHGQVIGFTGNMTSKNWTVEEGLKWLMEDDPHLGRRLSQDYDFGIRVKDFKDEPKYWTNPMAFQLPHAPNLKFVCYYGVGKASERSYFYKLDQDGKVDGLDKSVNDASRNVSDGVLMGEGDGTVTLLSLGYHCGHLWRQKSHNPAGLKVTTRELLHMNSGLLSRGPSSADHVDVMGNAEMAHEVLRIASGNDEDLHGDDRYYSRVLELARRVHLPSRP